MWDAPSLCEGWRTREVVAHMTMPARYDGPAFMAELEAAGGDFTALSNTVAARDGALPARRLLAGLRSDVLHGWRPPGGGAEGALTHCVIHGLDIAEAVPLERRVPDARIARCSAIVAGPGSPNLFGVDLSDVELRADDLEWSCGVRALSADRRRRWPSWRAAACCRRAGSAGRRPPLHRGARPGGPPARRRPRTRADQPGRGHHASLLGTSGHDKIAAMDPNTGDAPGPVRPGDPARTAYLPPIWGGQRSCGMRRSDYV